MKNKNNFWDRRYQQGNTGWNIGEISTPLKTYFDQLDLKDLKILIPGGGNSYEAEYLFHNGFSNVFVADISTYPLENFKNRVPEFPDSHIIHSDFFELTGHYELIIEQTFFCALDPSLRTRYVDKMHELLRPNGKLVGLLFQFPLHSSGPPYGGSAADYRQLFEKKFNVEIMAPAYNSIPPRAGRELFIKMIKA